MRDKGGVSESQGGVSGVSRRLGRSERQGREE